ncbi:MAG: glycosyltransferase family 39 protein [Oscillospiraceae bacterium]
MKNKPLNSNFINIDFLTKIGFLIGFTALTFLILFYNREFGYNKVILIPMVAVVLLSLVGALYFTKKSVDIDFIISNRYKILIGVIIFLFVIQSIMGYLTIQTLNHDIGKVYNGADLYVNNPNHPEYYQYSNYLNHWTNNTGIFVFFVGMIKFLNLIGFTNYYLVAVLIGQIFFSLAVLFTFLYLDKAFNSLAAVFSLIFWLIFPVVYLQGASFYTDTYSIAFVPMSLYFLHTAKEQNVLYKSGIYAFLAGLSIFCGKEMKATVLIVVIAWALYQIFQNQKAKSMLIVVIATITLMCFSAISNSIKYNIVLTSELVEPTDTPTIFWVMMGLSGRNGEYNYMDEDSIRYIPTQAQKKEYCYNKIAERLNEKGFVGTIDFMLMKASRTFGCGDADIDYMLSRGPIYPDRTIYQFIMQDGKYFSIFNNVNQAVYVAINILVALGAFLSLKDKKHALSIPYIAIGGFVVFMLLWESNHRQLVNQWPLYFMAASVGLYYIFNKMPNYKK